MGRPPLSREAVKIEALEEVANDSVQNIPSYEAGNEKETEKVIEAGSVPYVETYWWVVFSERGSKEEHPNVQLGINGEWIVAERGKPVVVASRFLENADHTKSDDYTLEADKPLQVTSASQTYSYTRLREATKEEWERRKEEGNKMTREKLQIQQARGMRQ